MRRTKAKERGKGEETKGKKSGEKARPFLEGICRTVSRNSISLGYLNHYGAQNTQIPFAVKNRISTKEKTIEEVNMLTTAQPKCRGTRYNLMIFPPKFEQLIHLSHLIISIN